MSFGHRVTSIVIGIAAVSAYIYPYMWLPIAVVLLSTIVYLYTRQTQQVNTSTIPSTVMAEATATSSRLSSPSSSSTSSTSGVNDGPSHVIPLDRSDEDKSSSTSTSTSLSSGTSGTMDEWRLVQWETEWKDVHHDAAIPSSIHIYSINGSNCGNNINNKGSISKDKSLRMDEELSDTSKYRVSTINSSPTKCRVMEICAGDDWIVLHLNDWNAKPRNHFCEIWFIGHNHSSINPVHADHNKHNNNNDTALNNISCGPSSMSSSAPSVPTLVYRWYIGDEHSEASQAIPPRGKQRTTAFSFTIRPADHIITHSSILVIDRSTNNPTHTSITFWQLTASIPLPLVPSQPLLIKEFRRNFDPMCSNVTFITTHYHCRCCCCRNDNHNHTEEHHNHDQPRYHHDSGWKALVMYHQFSPGFVPTRPNDGACHEIIIHQLNGPVSPARPSTPSSVLSSSELSSSSLPPIWLDDEPLVIRPRLINGKLSGFHHGSSAAPLGSHWLYTIVGDLENGLRPQIYDIVTGQLLYELALNSDASGQIPSQSHELLYGRWLFTSCNSNTNPGSVLSYVHIYDLTAPPRPASQLEPEQSGSSILSAPHEPFSTRILFHVKGETIVKVFVDDTDGNNKREPQQLRFFLIMNHPDDATASVRCVTVPVSLLNGVDIHSTQLISDDRTESISPNDNTLSIRTITKIPLPHHDRIHDIYPSWCFRNSRLLSPFPCVFHVHQPMDEKGDLINQMSEIWSFHHQYEPRCELRLPISEQQSARYHNRDNRMSRYWSLPLSYATMKHWNHSLITIMEHTIATTKYCYHRHHGSMMDVCTCGDVWPVTLTSIVMTYLSSFRL
jgi:hypothetical protein